MRLIKIFFLTLLISQSTQLLAYITAADLSYTCQGNGFYTFTLKVYGECEGDIDINNAFNQVLIIESESLGIDIQDDLTITLNRIASDDYYILCENREIICNGGTDRGLQVVTYQGSYNFGSLQQTDDWRIHWTKNYRSRELTSTFSTTDQPYYVETFIDNLNLVCNSSPQFGNAPITTSCISEENTYNPLINEADGDRLEFELANPRVGENTDLSLLPGYSVNRPFTTSSNISVNSGGEIDFTPTQAGQQTIVDLIVYEFRNGRQISKTSRAIQFNTFDCSNNIPTLSGFNGGTSFDTTFCVGQTLTGDDLYLLGADVDTELAGADRQNLSFEVLNGFASKTSTVTDGNDKKLRFNWTFSDADVGENRISIILKDDGCPVPREVIQEVTINIVARPIFELGNNFFLDCNNPEVLAPTVTGGGGTYSYVWTNWEPNIGLTDTVQLGGETFSSNKPQNIALTVYDQFGCNFTDYITLDKSITSTLTFEDWCVGLPTNFENQATSTHGTITNRVWDFGDGTVTTDISTTISNSYSAGTFDAKVITTDNKGCIDTAVAEVEMCVAPDFDFRVYDSCNNNVTLYDFTPYSSACALDVMSLSAGSYNRFTREILLSTTTVGNFPVAAHADLESGCTIDTTFNLNLLRSPGVQLQENGVRLSDFSLICDDPDTTLKAIITGEGNGGLTWQWRVTPQDGNINSGYVQINDSTIAIDYGGNFQVAVTDVLGCSSSDEVDILDLIDVDFAYHIVCDSGVPVQFIDSTETGLAVIDTYEWDFGDGNTSNQLEPSHTYASEGDFDVSLRVTDVNGCFDELTQEVFYTFPDGNIEVTTDQSNVVLCAFNDTITARIPSTTHADSIIWRVGNNQTLTYPDIDNFIYTVDRGRYVDNITFDQEGSFLVSLDLWYNENEGVAEGERCFKTYDADSTLEVKPRFDGYITVQRLCIGDSAEFKFNQTYGENIIDTDWEIYQWNDPSNVIYDTNALDPKLVFTDDIDLKYRAILTNESGCNIYKSSSSSLFIERNSQAYTELAATPCANEEAVITLKVNDEFASIREWYVYDQTTNQLVPPNPANPDITNITYIPGTLEENAIEDGVVRYQFSKPGKNVITVYMSGHVKAQNECRSVFHDTIYVADIPQPNFEIDTILCAEDRMSFTNTSTVTGDEVIENYLWTFPDGSTSSEQNASHAFAEGGSNTVSLLVNGTNCSNTLEDSVIYVKHKPRADFYYDEDELEAFIPIYFEDRSESETEIVSYFYDFGDGDTSNLADDSHIYDSISIYEVMHHVTTIEGCSDTIYRQTDLNVYLDIPNAFTPNGDGNNDAIGLVHKGIKDLSEYKIYNRWGQVVFDGGNDPDAVWDGTFKGIDQEFGVYVVIVKGFGAYDTEFEFKKNLTLIR